MRETYLLVVVLLLLSTACRGDGRTELRVTVRSSVALYTSAQVSVWIGGARIVEFEANEDGPVETPFSFTLVPSRDISLPRTIRVVATSEDGLDVGQAEDVRFRDGETVTISIGLRDDIGMDVGPPVDGGMDVGPPVDGGMDAGDALDSGEGCTGAPRCDGATRVFCESEREMRVACDDGCSDGQCNEMRSRYRPANFTSAIWDRAAGDLMVRNPVVFDTDTCEISSAATMVADGFCVVIATSMQITSAGELTISGSRPVAFIVTGDVDIAGVLDVSARGTSPGPGGGAGGVPDATDGRGVSGGMAGVHAGTWTDSGGGGGGLCSAGGRGGTSGDLGEVAGGLGGDAIEEWNGEPVIVTSGGGLGPGYDVPPVDNRARGGGGGGVVQISTLGDFALSGAISSGGGGGEPGGDDRLDGSLVNWGAGGGGGSGGVVVLEAESFSGDGVLNVGGGGGGGGEGPRTAASAGEDGSSNLDPAAGGNGGGAEGRDGGQGAGLGRRNGTNGDSIDVSVGNGGGGGGGAGCVVVHTERPSELDYQVAPREALRVAPRFE